MQDREGEAMTIMTRCRARIPLTRNDIIKIKTRALRKGVWYRVATRTERACIDLVIKVVERIRSRLLQNVVSSVLTKLEEAMESRVRRLIREVGSKLASRLSQIAQNWGNKSAVKWGGDSHFLQYLTITYMNEST